MNFKVDPDPQVLRAVSLLSAALQDFFKQVLSILSENPYRFRSIIHKDVAADGRVFYQYYDGIIPLVFLYRVFPAAEDWTEGAAGYVYIFGAERAWW